MSDGLVPSGRSAGEVGGDGTFGPYELAEADGSWWVLGWDPWLETFFAQRVERGPGGEGERILEDRGVHARELMTVEALEEAVGRRLPAPAAEALSTDARLVPPQDPFPMVPWPLRSDARTVMARHPSAEVREGWRTVVSRVAQLAADTTGERVSTLPAGPVADTFASLGHEVGLEVRSAGGQDVSGAVWGLAGFVANLGLDRSLATGILTGRIAALDAHQVGAVCEALQCSPFDLWGSVLAQAALSIYPPHRWPRRIEPLDSGRRAPTTLAEARQLLRDFVEAQAIRDLRDLDHVGGPDLDLSDTTAVKVTAYQQAAILERRPDGKVVRLAEGHAPADLDAEYHLAFRQAADPVAVRDVVPADAYSPHRADRVAGWDVDPTLAAVADQLRDRLHAGGFRWASGRQVAGPGVELVRFTPPAGREVWLHVDPAGGSWELVRDPRELYPGDPTDVVDPASWLDPGPGLADGPAPGPGPDAPDLL